MLDKDKLRPGMDVWFIRPECEDSPVLMGEIENVFADGVKIDHERLGCVGADFDALFPDEATARAAWDRDNKKVGIKLTFFKDSGKYYTEETVDLPDKAMQVFQVVDWLRDNMKKYRGMHLVAMLGELDHGYPIMIPADQRA